MYVLGIDIGGTKIRSQLFPVRDGQLYPEPESDVVDATQRGVSIHADQIANIVMKAQQEAKGQIVAVGIASPGRFGPDKIIKPGSNGNLEEVPGELDGICLQDLYQQRLSGDLVLHVMNDADAMLAGILQDLPDKVTSGRQIALLGLGTGLGHSIIRIEEAGEYQFITDGHAGKLRLMLDVEDITRLQQLQIDRVAWLPEGKLTWLPDGTVAAGDVMSGGVIAALAGVEACHQMDVKNTQHLYALQIAGKYMARLIALIASGYSQDIVPDYGWSEDDRAQAAKTELYIVSGGLGGSPLGELIIDAARKELHRLQLPDIVLRQASNVSAAPRAAARLALAYYSG